MDINNSEQVEVPFDIPTEAQIDRSKAFDFAGISDLIGKVHDKKQIGEYQPISETYKPMSETYKGTTYEPLQWDSKPYQKLDYQPYKHEKLSYEKIPYETYQHEPMALEPDNYEPFVMPPSNYKPLDNNLTPSDGDTLYDEQGKPWENNPVFKGTGMAGALFGSKDTQEVVEQPVVDKVEPVVPQITQQGRPIQIIRSVDFPGEHNKSKVKNYDRVNEARIQGMQ